MSHEIRTPMNGVIGMVVLLKDKTQDRKILGDLAIIESSGELLLSIVDDILDLSKIEAGKLSLEQIAFRPVEVLEQVKKMFDSSKIGNRNNLHIQTKGQIPVSVIGDSHRFSQIVVNLVGNAIKFTQDGNITIVVEAIPTDHSQTRLIVSIYDDGIGIPEDRIPHLFESFTQADQSTTRRFGGTGLGLSICKAIIDAWDGSIEVSSVLGKGSTFTFELTLPTCDKTEAKRDKVIKKDLRFPDLNVLVAEDNETNITVAKGFLSKLGIEATFVSDGSQAVQACAYRHFDIIFMDCHMPVMDGFEAAATILKMDFDERRPPVIVALTASIMEEDIRLCKSSGMISVLPKPITRKKLAEQLERNARAIPLLEGWVKRAIVDRR